MTYGILGSPHARPLAGALGATAMPSGLCAYFPYECQHWNEYPPDVQAQIAASYQQKVAYFNSQLAALKAQGGCNATASGRLAGQLKSVLVKAGGDPSKMDPQEDVFGPQECAEWWRVFGHAVTVEDAKAAVPATYYGGIKVTLTTVCGSNIIVPLCPKPLPPAPPPGGGGGGSGGGGGGLPPPLILPSKPKMSTANMLITGGVIAGVGVVGYAVAKKKGWIK